MTDLRARVLATVRRGGLWRQGERILVALSGGPDSVALLRLLHELQGAEAITIGAAHVNYGLRGAESDGDAAFCARTCDRLGVLLHSFRPEPHKRGNVQDWARSERRRMLEECAARGGYARVALGHTADDRAETFLLQLFRGAGPDALGSTFTAWEPYIRPQVELRRAELLAYLAANRIPFRTDRSNYESKYRRNRIRNELLPLVGSIWPDDAVAILNRQLDLLALDSACLDREADTLFSAARRGSGEIRLAASELSKYPPPLQLRALRRMARALGGAPSRDLSLALLDLLRGQPGRRVTLGCDLEAELSAEQVWMYRSRPKGRPIPVVIPGATVLPDRSRLVVKAATASPPYPDGRRAARIALGAGTVGWEVRPARAGDRMRPFGMTGTRLVMDLLADGGIPRHARGHAWVLVRHAEIFWLLGVRLAEPARVAPDDQNVYEFTWCAETTIYEDDGA